MSTNGAPAPAGVAARAAAVAAISTLIAGLGHAAGHGAVPDASALMLTVVTATGLGLVLARAGWTPWRLVGVLAAVQVAVHTAAWVSGGAGHGPDPRLADMASTAPMHHAAPFTTRMLVAHVVAVVVAAVVLAGLDRAGRFFAHLARRVLHPVRRVLIPSPLRAPLVGSSRPVSLPMSPHLAVVRGNAPPWVLGIG